MTIYSLEVLFSQFQTSPCLILSCFLTCIQVSQVVYKVVWYSHLLKNFPVCCGPHSLLDFKKIQPVHPKGDQPWVFIGRTDVEAETPILWPPRAKSWLIGKAPNAGTDWGQKEKGMTGWDDWMASPAWWTWLWVDSGSWWWTGRPGVLRCMGSQRVGHDWATELNWTDTVRGFSIVSVIFFWNPLAFSVIQRMLAIWSLVPLCMYVLSHILLFATSWTVAHQAPFSMGFPRKEYWSGLPFPPLGDHPNPGIKLGLWPRQANSLPLCHRGAVC